MRKVILLIFLIALLSGCIKPTTQVKELRICKDRLITLEDYSVSALSLSPDSTSLLKFIVRNNCNREIKVTIDFFDTSNLEVVKLECIGCNEKSTNGKISLNLMPFDARTIHVILKPKLKVESPLPSPASFKISYTFINNASATIPVIDGITVTRPKSKFKQNVMPSPIKLYFEPPVGGYRKEDNRIIKEYWITSSQQTFDITFKFKVLKPKRGELIPVKVEIMEIEGINIEEVKQDKCSGRVIDLEKKKEIRCKFRTTGNAPAYSAILKVSYKFNYGFILTENFVILP